MRAVVVAGLILGSAVPAAPVHAAVTVHPAGRSASVAFDTPLPAVGVGANARMSATGQLKAHASEWGLDQADLAYDSIAVSALGSRTARFRQQIDGVPVLGSLVSLTIGTAGELLSMTAVTSDAPVATVRMTPSQARAAISRVTSTTARVSGVSLAIADQRLLEGLPTGSHFVWTATVSGWKTTPEVVYVSDADGSLVGHAPTVRDAAQLDTTPLVCDRAWGYIDLSSAAGMPLCSQASSIVGSSAWAGTANAVALDDLARVSGGIQRTRDFYSTYIKSDYSSPTGVDVNSEQYLGNIAPDLNYGYTYGGANLANAQACDAATPIIGGVCTPRISAFINTCVVGYTCHYFQNAFWIAWDSGKCASNACSAVFFGTGWGADDVVAHELTHGITGSVFTTTVNNEANALSEAYSDFFAEPVDQLTVDPGEQPDPTWGFGEDVGYSSQTYTRRPEIVRAGPFRTIADVLPGEYQTIGSGWDRTADAHYNLGPADRFAWLIANGGTQGGWSIAGLGTEPRTAGNANGLCDTADECTGMIRMTQLMFQALPKLTESATYFAFGQAVITACSDLTALAVPGFTTTSCAQVKSALTATRIWKVSLGGLTSLAARSPGVSSTIRAQLLTSTGAPAQGVRVSLQVRRRSSMSWRTVTTRTTDASGRVRYSAVFANSQYYRVVTRSSATVPSTASIVKRVIVR